MFNCHVCGHSPAKSEFVSEVFTVDDRRVLVEHIPASVCEHFVSAELKLSAMIYPAHRKDEGDYKQSLK
jgi:YgiT-type zinc finger domain-containing protein